MPHKNEIETALHALGAGSFDSETPESRFQELSFALTKLDNLVREQMQSETSERIKVVIRKLDADEELDADELELIRLWMVSDAELYVQMENDYRDWLSELGRVLDQIGKLRSGKSSLEVFAKISGAVRDALRVTADIIFFKQQQDRIRRFDAATKRLYAEDKRVIARLLRQKLLSPDA